MFPSKNSIFARAFDAVNLTISFKYKNRYAAFFGEAMFPKVVYPLPKIWIAIVLSELLEHYLYQKLLICAFHMSEF